MMATFIQRLLGRGQTRPDQAASGLGQDLESVAAQVSPDIKHHPDNPDVWRGRFDAHIRGGVDEGSLIGQARETVKHFRGKLSAALIEYQNDPSADRDRGYLVKINETATQALDFFIDLGRDEELYLTIDSLRFDLKGLAEVLGGHNEQEPRK
ncbi:Uncharacterised protein [Mycobacteroides abscessus subsp. massiliense]|nr:Uncharacterised protein [Mycobacteroides abscessus subsp. massiliense]